MKVVTMLASWRRDWGRHRGAGSTLGGSIDLAATVPPGQSGPFRVVRTSSDTSRRWTRRAADLRGRYGGPAVPAAELGYGWRSSCDSRPTRIADIVRVMSHHFLIRSGWVLGFAWVAGGCSTTESPVAAHYYPGPGDSWERRAPAEVGMDAAVLEEAVAYANAHETSLARDAGVWLRERFAGQPYQDIVGPTKPRGGVNGIVLRRGYIVAEWGDTRRVDMNFSVTKSYLSTVAGLAYDRGIIRSLDDPVVTYVQDGTFDDPHNSGITWRHLLQQTSEWTGTLWDKPDVADRRRGIDREIHEPGTFWEYNDVRVNLLAYALLHVWRRPLPEILRDSIMDRIGASATWRWHGYETSWTTMDGLRVQSVSGGGHWGGGLWVSTRDHARFGYLLLRRGAWSGRQLVSEEWIDRAVTPTDIQPDYGFMWWLNTGRRQFPAVPETSFFALGAGSTNVIWVDPEHDLVAVTRWVDGGEHVNEFMRLVLASIRE